jgi:flagellar hook-associated protein 3 FlgL
MRGNQISSTIARTQANLQEVQQQLTTGKRLAAPSDDAGDAAIAGSIRKLLEQRGAYKTNLDAANNNLAESDSALSDATDLLREAQNIASANVGSDVTSDQREAAATIIDSIYSQMLTTANKSVAGSYLFAGDRSTEPPFVEAGGGVKWVGSTDVLSNSVDEGTDRAFMVDGSAVFGALASRVQGDQDVSPSLSLNTRLADLGGVGGGGVNKGIIQLSDGTTPTAIDLRDADTIGDVIDRINAAGVGGITASLNTGGTGIDLTAGAGDDVTVYEVGGGTMASDLGILQTTGSGAGVNVLGANTSPKITSLTPLSALNGGTGIDLTGISITNGGITKTVSLTGATTVEDLLNSINDSGANVKAQINAAGTGIDILNAVQGIPLTIAENGGTTASELGVRSFAPSTKLSDLNDGYGITNVEGTELKLTDSAGVSFEVDFDGAITVQDVLDKVNAAATAAGASVTASFATATNGIVLTDGAGGGGTLAAANVNNSSAVKELGLEASAASGVISGTDVGAVSSQGVFANLIRLRNALRNDDQTEITKAAEQLSDDTDRVVRIRGGVGAKVQEFDKRTESLADQNVTTKALLGQLEDTDFTDAIIKFQTLQTSLQAAMQSAGINQQLSLMDYL